MDEAPPRPPFRLVVSDGLARSRLTVFFRLFLAIPHFFWLVLWGIAATVVSVVLWIATLVSGTPPRELHAFVSAYIRYATHLSAWFNLAANPYPGFSGAPGYPVDIEIDPPAPQSRLTVARLSTWTPGNSATSSSAEIRRSGVKMLRRWSPARA